MKRQIDHPIGTHIALLHAGNATPSVRGGAIVNGTIQQGLDALPIDKVTGPVGQAQTQNVSHQDRPKFPHVLGTVNVIGRYVEAQRQGHGDENKSANGVEYLDWEGDAMTLVLIVEHPRQGVRWSGRVDVDGVGRPVHEELEGIFFDYQFFPDGAVVSVVVG